MTRTRPTRGIPSHVAPETPGSIHEGGELGYALSHAFGAAFDNPDLLVACVVGDGEAETGPLANSNRWGAVFEVTDRCSTAGILPGDDRVAPNGRVMEILSEHQCEGWLEGYLLTGRHGFFSCYEAFIHIVDSKLQPQSEHPHGMSDKEFDVLFTKDKPIIFAHHGYPMLIHRLTYRRTNHQNLHVRGIKEEGTTSTPFDMVVMNDLDRFHLVADVIDRVPSLAPRAAYAKQALRDKLIEHKQYIGN